MAPNCNENASPTAAKHIASKLIHLIIPLLLLSTLPTPGRTQNTSAVDTAMDTGLDGLYGMTNTFLGGVVQPHDLTYIAAKLKIEKIGDLMDMNKIAADKMTLVTYGIGFAVCVAIGIISIVVMLFACCCFPCCRCCGNCGGKDPQERGKKRKSHCCFVVTGVVLLVITLMLIAVNITMYCTSGRLHQQLTSGLFTDIDSGLKGMDSFLGGVVDQMNVSVLDKYIVMENKLLGKLDAVPSAAMDMLNKETGVRTTLDGLSTFTGNLPELNSTLHQTSALAAQLNTSTEQLWENFTKIEQTLQTKLASCNPLCTTEINLVKSTQIAVNFSAVDLTAATFAVEEAIKQDMDGLVRSSRNELDKVRKDINDTMASSTNDIKGNCEDGEKQIRDMLSMFSDVLNGFSISSFLDMVSDGKKMISSYSMYIQIALLALCVYMTLILVMNLLGLLFGATLRQRKAKDGKCCRCDRWVASHFMLTSAALTFLFFWLYMFIVVLTFLLGGLMHTEFCRHVVNLDDPKSAKVLDLVDSWVNGTISVPNVELLPFGMYRECSKPEVTIYKALNLEKSWNLTSMINTGEMDRAVTDLKAKDFSVPQVNLTNDLLRSLLLNLDATLGRLDFQNMNDSVDGPITSPEISTLVTQLSALDTRDTNINIATEIQQLNDLITNSVTPISAGRDELMKLLYKDQWLIGQTNFKDAADNLQDSQDTINTNGTYIVSRFVNSTADEIYSDVTNFTRSTIYGVEHDIARCQPMHNSMKTLLEAICVRTLYPLNGFWFAIGWCMAFLVPGLILAVQLASVYRYPAGQNSVGHSDDADALEAEGSRKRLPPLSPAETKVLTSGKPGHDIEAAAVPSGQRLPTLSPAETKEPPSGKPDDVIVVVTTASGQPVETKEPMFGNPGDAVEVAAAAAVSGQPVETKEPMSGNPGNAVKVAAAAAVSGQPVETKEPMTGNPGDAVEVAAAAAVSGQPVETKEPMSGNPGDAVEVAATAAVSGQPVVTKEPMSGNPGDAVEVAAAAAVSGRPVETKEPMSGKSDGAIEAATVTSDQPAETKESTSVNPGDAVEVAVAASGQRLPPLSPAETKEPTAMNPEKKRTRKKKNNKVHAAPPEEIGSSEA